MDNKMTHFTLRMDRLSLQKFRYIAEWEGRSTNKTLERYIKRRVAEFEAENGIIDKQDLPYKSR